jgi:DNA-binding winged helix-turn-helix (wHTH) protein/Tol biopolymer transport system component
MSAAQDKGKPSQLHFGGHTLDLERRALYRGQQRIHLTSKPLETLVYLVDNPGRIVEKQELLDAVWKDTFVTEDNLVHAIREIRRALGDDKEDPRFVQTVPRQGYRFVGQVTADAAIPVATQPDLAATPLAVVVSQQKMNIRRWVWIAAPAVGLILVLTWMLWPRDRSRGFKPSAGEQHVGTIKGRVTGGEFSSAKPTFSPDGKLMLYVSSSAGTRGYGDIFIKQFPEGTPLRITNSINPSGDLPVFTGDGNHVVFSIPRVDQNQDRHHDLWRVPSLGGPPERFVEDASGAGFSPGDEWVAYTKYLPSGQALWLSPINALNEHVVVSAGGYTPRWSPNGEWLAYTTSDPNGGAGDIWICHVTKSNTRQLGVSAQKQLTMENHQIYGLSWAADSRSIIFSSKRSGPAQLYLVSTIDGSVSPLLVGVGEYAAPSASPDGRTVIFHNSRLVNDLMLTTLDGSCNGKGLTYGEFQRWPRISPSGTKLVSVMRQANNTEQLHLTDLKTREESHLTERAARYPCWLDSDTVAFLSPDGAKKNTEVLVVDINTREAKALTLVPGEANWLAIHPETKRVAVVMKSPAEKESILLRDLSAQTDTTIHEGSEYEDLRWSPDGSSLSWTKPGVSRNAPHLSGGIWTLQLGQPDARLIATGGYCPVWSEDGGSVYYTMREGRQGLWRYELRQKKEHLVCSWERVFSFDIVGNLLVFTQHRNDSQIYSMSLYP